MSNAQPKTAGHPQPQVTKQPPSRTRPQQVEDKEFEEEVGKSQLLAMAPSWLFSFVSHLILILFLAFWLLPLVPERGVAIESGTQSGHLEDSLDINLESLDSESLEELDSSAIETDFQNEIAELSTPVELPTTEISDIGSQFARPVATN